MFKWAKKIVIKKVKIYLNENLDELVKQANKKIDIPDMTEEQEQKHFDNLKIFGKELIENLLDIWANK